MSRVPDDTNPDHVALFNGDKNEWERFVRHYSPVIWSAVKRTFIIYYFPWNKEDAEDAYCSIFVSLLENDFKKLRIFRQSQGCSFCTFLTVIAVRATIDYIRKEKHRMLTKSCSEEGTNHLLENIRDSAKTAFEVLEEAEKNENFRRVLHRLSEKDREMYDLIFDKELTSEGIAGLLRIPVNAVYLKKFRLVEKLKKEMKELERPYV